MQNRQVETARLVVHDKPAQSLNKARSFGGGDLEKRPRGFNKLETKIGL